MKECSSDCNQDPSVPRDQKKIVCSIGVLLVLAPSPKPTKHEKVMAMLEELSKQFEGFQDMMKQSLDKLCALE